MDGQKEISTNQTTDTKKKVGCFKGCLTPIIVFFIFAALIGSCFGDENVEDVDTTKEKEETVSKVAAENEKVKKEDDSTTNKVSAKEVDYYQSTLAPKLDAIQKEYDRIWNEQWITTFEGISDGSVNVYDAYKSMTFIETNYRVLSDNIAEISGKDLSKENNRLLEDFTAKLEQATDYRAFAASEAANMFDDGNFKPSEFESIKTIVSMADNEMISALVDRVSIENNLGLIEKTAE